MSDDREVRANQEELDDRSAIRDIMDCYDYDEETATEVWERWKQDLDDEARNR